jgi:hypothetical protein
MKRFWTGVARFLAVLGCFAFVFTALFALVLVSVDGRLLNAGIYKRALASRQVYQRMPRLIAEQLSMPMSFNPCAENPLQCENPTAEFTACAIQALGQERYDLLTSAQDQPSQGELGLLQECAAQYSTVEPPPDGEPAGGPPAFMQSLSVSDWEAVISALLPPDDLKLLSETVLDQIFAFMDGQRDTVTVPLADLRRRIAGQGGVEAMVALIRAQPPCTDEQLAAMQASLSGGEGETVLCRPPEEELQALMPQIQAQLEMAAAGIPDEATLLTPEFGENSAEPGPFGTGAVGALRGLRLLMRLSPNLALFCLLFISLFAVRTARGWLRWWGTPFTLAGSIAAAIAIASAASFEEVWLGLLADRIPSYLTLGTAALLHDLLQAIFGAFMAGIRNGGLLLALLGLVMWVGSFFIRTRGPALAPEAPPAPPPSAG